MPARFIYLPLFWLFMTLLSHPEYQHVLLVRHAETEHNAHGIVQGHVDTSPKRNDVPDALVEAVLALEAEAGPLQAVYTTDLKRGCYPAMDLVNKIEARKTEEARKEDSEARAVYLFLKATPDLRERNLGGYQGQSYDVLIPPTPGQVVDKAVRRQQLIKILRELDDVQVQSQGGESLVEFKARIHRIADTYVRPAKGYRILLSHMGVLDHMLDELGDRMPTVQFSWANTLQCYHLVLKEGNLVEKRDFTPEISYPADPVVPVR